MILLITEYRSSYLENSYKFLDTEGETIEPAMIQSTQVHGESERTNHLTECELFCVIVYPCFNKLCTTIYCEHE